MLFVNFVNIKQV